MSRKRDNWIYRHRLKWAWLWHGALLVSWKHHREKINEVIVRPVRYARFKKK